MIAFAGWDYGSLGDKETKLKQKNILYRLQVRRSLSPLSSSGSWSRFLHVFVSSCQVDLEEERLKNQAAALTLKQKVFLYSLRVLLLFLALGLIAAALFGIFQATQFSQVNRGNAEPRCDVVISPPFLISLSLCSENERAGGNRGFAHPVPSIHRHHRWKLCGAAAV